MSSEIFILYYRYKNMPKVQRQPRLMVTTTFHRTNAPVVRERTFSHHNGPDYGSTLARKLTDGESQVKAMETGVGYGTIARSFTKYLQSKGIPYQYTMTDLATAHFDGIRRRFADKDPAVSLVNGDALSLPFREGAFSLTISNEMIGDLPTLANLSHKAIEENPIIKEILSLFNINLNDAPPTFALNIGAWILLNEISRTLSLGGKFFVSENDTGIPGRNALYPSRIELQGHIEYKIHFGHLNSAAEAIGFQVESTGSLLAFMGIQMITMGERDPGTPLNLSYSVLKKGSGFNINRYNRIRKLYSLLEGQLPQLEDPGIDPNEVDRHFMMSM